MPEYLDKSEQFAANYLSVTRATAPYRPSRIVESVADLIAELD
jgi:hypothetical protein